MEEFCIKLQSTIVNQRHSNIKTVVSDLNAKTGSDNTGYKQIIGKRGLEVVSGIQSSSSLPLLFSHLVISVIDCAFGILTLSASQCEKLEKIQNK